jgi:hypothetical protein
MNDPLSTAHTIPRRMRGLMVISNQEVVEIAERKEQPVWANRPHTDSVKSGSTNEFHDVSSYRESDSGD